MTQAILNHILDQLPALEEDELRQLERPITDADRTDIDELLRRLEALPNPLHLQRFGRLHRIGCREHIRCHNGPPYALTLAQNNIPEGVQVRDVRVGRHLNLEEVAAHVAFGARRGDARRGVQRLMNVADEVEEEAR